MSDLLSEALSPYVTGWYQPLGAEIDLTDLPVQGELPAGLNGWLYRIGPDPIGPVGPKHHWFVGDGMVHGIRLQEGRALRYRNRWVRTAATAAKLGEADPGGPTHDQSMFDISNTDLIGFGGQLLSTTETCMPHRLTTELDTLGRTDFGARGGLTGGFATHPKLDPVTGELHGVTYRWRDEPYYLYHHIGADGRWISTTPITVPAATMVHDMAITEHHAVIFDLPVLWNYDRQAEGWSFPLQWSDDYQARIGVMALGGGPVQWFDIEPCYVFHTFNAFETTTAHGRVITLDAVRHERVCQTNLHGPGEPYPPLATRWTLNLTSGAVSEDTIHDRAVMEFPQTDHRVLGRRHHHGYAAQLAAGPGDDGGFGKVHFDTGTVTTHSFGPGTSVSEPIFVPDPDGTADDDGWLLGTVYHHDTDTSDMVVVDAHDLTAPTVARVPLPHRIPAGFHGAWIPTSLP